MRRRLLAAAAALWLAGCATQPPQAPTDSARSQSLWAQRQSALGTVTGFELQGRIATGALPGSSGTLNWRQRGERFEATFSGALGIGGLRVQGDGEQLDVTTKDGHFDRADAEDLLQRKLGWTPPWGSLRWWVLGLPEPSTPAVLQLDDSGRLATLDQADWHLDYLEYRQPELWDAALPRRIELHRGDEKIRVVVDVWQQIDRGS